MIEKLGNKDYDLDFLVTQFENLSLDINTNPSVFCTTLTKLNKHPCNEAYGKDFTRDEKELYIKYVSVLEMNTKKLLQHSKHPMLK